MQIRYFEWDEKNSGHIWEHHVETEEAEQACKQCPFLLRGRHGSYLVHGRTLAGRYLFVVVRYQGNGLVRVITARDMDMTEKKLYQEHR